MEQFSGRQEGRSDFFSATKTIPNRFKLISVICAKGVYLFDSVVDERITGFPEERLSTHKLFIKRNLVLFLDIIVFVFLS